MLACLEWLLLEVQHVPMVFSNLSNPSQMQITLDLVLDLVLGLVLGLALALDLVVPTLDNTALNQASLLFVPVLLCPVPHLEVMAQLTPHHLFVSMR
jgi:hypothetical protein